MLRRARFVIVAVLVFSMGSLGLPSLPEATAAPGASNPITYVYDELGRLTAAIDPTAASNGVAGYSYSDVGNLTQITRSGTASVDVFDLHPRTTAIGGTVEIFGAGFSSTVGNNRVRFTTLDGQGNPVSGSQGVLATILGATVTKLTVEVPSGAVEGPVWVRNTTTSTNALSSQSWSPNGSPPQITSMTPTQANFGDTITLDGSGFGSHVSRVKVYVNGASAVVTSAAPTQLTFQVPPQISPGTVEVHTANGSATAPTDLALPLPNTALDIPDPALSPPFDQVVRISPVSTTQLTLAAGQSNMLVLFSAKRNQTMALRVTSSDVVQTRVIDPTWRNDNIGSYGLAPPILTQEGDYAIGFKRYSWATGTISIEIQLDLADVQYKGSFTPSASPGTLVTVSRSHAGESARFTFPGVQNRCYAVQTQSGYPLGPYGDNYVYAPSQPGGAAHGHSSWHDQYLFAPLAQGGSTFQAPETGTYSVLTRTSLPWVQPGGISPNAQVRVRVIDHGPCAGGSSALTKGGEEGEELPILENLTADRISDEELTDRIVDSYEPADPAAWDPESRSQDVWFTDRGPSPLEELPLPRADQDRTALAGRVLLLNGAPLPGVAVSAGKVETTTDRAGGFLLEGIGAGRVELTVDGRPANTRRASYGIFEIGVDIEAGRTNELGYTVWMPELDLSTQIHIDEYPLKAPLVVTSDKMPGFEVHIPAGSTIVDDDGEPVHDITLTPIPLDRQPFPGPELNEFTMHFTLQPGDAYVEPNGFRVVYANNTDLPPGYIGKVWEYEPDHGWEFYGHATVTKDGEQVVPDRGARVYGFQGASLSAFLLAESDPLCDIFGGVFCSSDPVNYGNGLFTYEMTDLALPGTPPLELTRTYRQNDATRYGFGQGMTFSYDYRLTSDDISNGAVLGIPGRERVTFEPSGGAGSGVPMVAVSGPPEWIGAELGKKNNLTYSIRRSDGARFFFYYGSALTEMRDPGGNRIIVNRDVYLRPTSILAMPSGRWISFTYTGGGSAARIGSATDSTGRTVSYTYEQKTTGMYRMLTATDAEVPTAVTTYQWDNSSVVCSTGVPCTPSPATYLRDIWDRRGNHEQHLDYAANGCVTQQTFANGGTFTFDYGSSQSDCSGGTRVTTPNGNVTCAMTGTNHRPTSVTHALGSPVEHTAAYTYQAGTNAVKTIQETFKVPGGGTRARTTGFTYDARGNVKKVTYLQGSGSPKVWNLEYDPGTNGISKIIDPLAHERRFTYSYPQGCLARAEDHLGRGVTLTCIVTGQVKRITDDLSNQTLFNYANGDLTKVTDPLGAAASLFTGADGLPRIVTDPLGQRTRFDYDANVNLKKVTPPAGSSTSFTYDQQENLTQITLDATGATTGYAYNAVNLPSSMTDPLSRSETYTYDAAGNLKRRTDRRGNVNRYCYNALDLVKFIGYGYTGGGEPNCGSTFTSTTDLTYDGAGRLRKVEDSRAGIVTRDFDDLDRLTNETTPEASVTYTYDDANRRATMQVGTGPVVSYTHTNNDLPKTITRGTNVVTYAYDQANRPKSYTLPNGIVQAHTYDAASRLTRIDYDKGQTHFGDLVYGYDAAGRRTSVHGTSARITLPTATSATASYDAANQLTSWNGQGLTYEADGSLKTFGSQTYSYNDRNQLTATSGGAATFSYDGLGRRTTKVVSGTTTRSVYDGPNVVQERNASGAVTFDLLTGFAPDQVFWRSGGTNTTTNSLLTDAIGSTVATTTPTANPAIRNAFTYTPHGTPDSAAFPYLFTGRDFDQATGLQYNRARWYHPGTGRFTSEDPIGILGGSANLYLYGLNSPVNRTDPWGLEPGGTRCGFSFVSCPSSLGAFFAEALQVAAVLTIMIAVSGLMVPVPLALVVGSIWAQIGLSAAASAAYLAQGDRANAALYFGNVFLIGAVGAAGLAPAVSGTASPAAHAAAWLVSGWDAFLTWWCLGDEGC